MAHHHFIKTCKKCGTVISQCRCMSKDKATEVGICKSCEEKTTTSMDGKQEARTDILIDIKHDLIGIYGQDSYFMADLDSIITAINDRIELIKKGEV